MCDLARKDDVSVLNWMDVSGVSFNALLLLERVQIGWLPGWAGTPRRELALALRANPAVEWYLRHKCPEAVAWLDGLMADRIPPAGAAEVRAAEVAVLRSLMDLIVYALDPGVYDSQPLLGWDSAELTGLADFRDATVIDVGAGTGRLALTLAPLAARVFAVEPVANLRHYLKAKAKRMGCDNVFVVDGLITDIPYPDGTADATVAGHVYGDQPPEELAELRRVTRRGGMIVLCPGHRDVDGPIHSYLVKQGFAWSRFEEPRDGMMRKYWRRV